jgi:6-pyruvoyltetrahydropterin/6-carboxytetrahydropterin synthase
MAFKSIVGRDRKLTDEESSIFVDGRFFGGSFSATQRVSDAPHGGNRLHGHTYEVAVRLLRKPGSQGKIVFPFEVLMNIVKDVCAELNNKVLLASGGENVYKEDSVILEYVAADDKRYMFPMGDVKLLPLEDVTIEALTSWIGAQIVAKLKEYPDFHGNIGKVEITLYEGRQRGCTIAAPLT